MKNYLNRIMVHPVKFFIAFVILFFLLIWAAEDVFSQSKMPQDTSAKKLCPPCSGCPPCGFGAPAYCCNSRQEGNLPAEYKILPKELVEQKRVKVKP